MYLGNSKQTEIFVFFLILSLTAAGQSGKSHKYRFNGDLSGNNVVSSNQSITINYSLSEIDIESIENDYGSFYRISIPGHTAAADPGKPEYPVLNRLITIPDGSKYSIKISNVKSTKLNPARQDFKGLLFPAQPGVAKQVQTGKAEFVMDKKLYSTRGLIKSDTVRIEYLGKVRSKELSNLVISPVRYDPRSNSLNVITSMTIEVSFYREIISSSKSSSSESLLFNQSLLNGVLNYYPKDVITGYSDQPVEMIVLTDTTFKKYLEPFFKWKRQKGFKLNIIYRGAGHAGENYEDIKRTISDIYAGSAQNGHPPEYLLIIGDTKKIPSYGSGYLTDMYYGEFDGNGDYFPDLFIGRVPASDTSSVKSFVKKIIQYERFEFADTNKFYSNALAFAGKDASYANYMNGQVKYGVTNYLTPANRIKEFHFYYPDGHTKKDSVIKLISKGLSYINYSGHGSSEGWLHIEIKSPDVAKLTNKNMYPFVISNACRTAQFDDTASFGNKMVMAAQKGAIGFIGCSNDSYWDEDFYWSVGTGTPSADPKYTMTGLGAYDRLFHTHSESPSDWYISMGQINYAGNLSVSASSSLRKKYYWETYTLLGDPSAMPVIGNPLPFNFTLPDTLPNGIKSLSVTIDPFAYIAVSHFDTLWDATHASPSGSAVLDMPGLSNDSCLVVITGQNRKPLIKTIYFSDLNREYVNLSGTDLNDIDGNNNHLADFGETMFLKLKISNLGLKDATNLSAAISSTSPWLTINTGNAVIGTLPARSETFIDNILEISIDNNVPDLGIITIDLTLKDSRTEKKYKIDIIVHAPELEIMNCIIDDSEVGNNNLIADPGETFNLIFQVRNTGSSNTSGQMVVNSVENKLEILNPNVKSGVLHFGEISNIPIMVKLAESALYGDYIPLTSVLDCSPFVVNRNFVFRVGRIRENFETGSFKVFPWINMSSKPWITTNSSSADGYLAARSGMIGHNANSGLKIRAFYPEADSLRFWYNVSSEANYDYFQFNLNDVEIMKISGESGWQRKSIGMPAGLNKLEWVYRKDNSVSQGADCALIDLIDFSSTVPVKYITKDIELRRIITPVQKEIYGMEPVTVTVKNFGIDTLKAFNLAYTINDRFPVSQYFKTKPMIYGDSVNVVFDRRADLDLNGIYDITAYSTDDDDYLFNDTLTISLENTEIEESVNIFPNPFTSELNITINSKSNNNLRISLSDVSGKHRIYVEKEIVEGENYITLDTKQLSPALYILNIRGSTLSKAYSLIKVKQ